MKRWLLLLIVVMVLGLRGLANAALIDRGGGLIYDSVFNITWLQDAGLGGKMRWDDAMRWADNLVYQGYDDWRLPTALNRDGSGPCRYFLCTDSEMGHLYYTELGNQQGGPLTNTGPFINLQSYYYWSGTEVRRNPDAAWFFDFRIGHQENHLKWNYFYAWAVRPGDSVPVPEPATMLLLGSGLAGLALLRRVRRRHG